MKMFPSKFQLRDYQKECIGSIAEKYSRGENKILSVLATGLGKTVIFSHLPHFMPDLAKHGILVLVHRDELVFQAEEKFRESNPGLRVAVEKAEFSADSYCDVVVASVQTIGRFDSARLNKFLHRFGIIITDEAHHVVASTYKRILDSFGVGDSVSENYIPLRENGSVIKRLSLGFTATANRSDGVGIGKFYKSIAMEYDIKEAVRDGYLVDIVAELVYTDTDISEVKTVRGDFAKKQLQEAVNKKPRNQRIISGYLQKRDEYELEGYAIAFCAGVAHAHSLAADFIEAGVPAVAIDSNTDKDIRREFIASFKRGEIKILCNYGVLTEGFDAPRVDILLMCRPTQSATLYAQMMGRGTRPVCNVNFDTPEERKAAIENSSKKMLLVLDFVDIVRKHQLITATNLAGLKSEFQTNGEKLFTTVVKQVEEIEQHNPLMPVREAESFTEVKVMAVSIDVWGAKVGNIIEKSRSIQELSRFAWLQIGNSYQLSVPDDRSTPFVIKLEQNAIGEWDITRLDSPKFVDYHWVPGKRLKAEHPAPSLDEALRRVDSALVSKFGHVSHLMEHTPRWGKGPASEGQLKYLKSFGIELPPGSINKGRASMLISAAKMMNLKRVKK